LFSAPAATHSISAHLAAALMPLPFGGILPPKIIRGEDPSTAMVDWVPLMMTPFCCPLSHVYPAEALLAEPWQPWQVVEKPSLVQIEDHVGAAPTRGGQLIVPPLPLPDDDPPLLLELPLLELPPRMPELLPPLELELLLLLPPLELLLPKAAIPELDPPLELELLLLPKPLPPWLLRRSLPLEPPLLELEPLGSMPLSSALGSIAPPSHGPT